MPIPQTSQHDVSHIISWGSLVGDHPGFNQPHIDRRVESASIKEIANRFGEAERASDEVWCAWDQRATKDRSMEHAAKTKYDRELEHISKTLSGPDAATVDAALALLGEHRQTTEDLKVLAEKLMEIETEHESDAAAVPDQMGKNDLAACIMALEAVFDFLNLRVYSLNLGILRNALVEIVLGASPAAMFQPEQHGRGRRLDSHLVQEAKGMLAGVMEVQQKAGMSRPEAAEWIVKNVSPTLASRISAKPLTPRVVEEWLDKWGGKSGEKGVARDSYLLWRTHDPVDPKRFRQITEHTAKRLPARKPK